MSVTYKHDNVVLIDHKNFLNNLYSSNVATIGDEKLHVYQVLPQLFCINAITSKNRETTKRKLDCDGNYTEVNVVKNNYNTFITKIPDQIRTELMSWNISDTSTVRDLARGLFGATAFKLDGISGGNNSPTSLKCKIKDDYFLIPPNCRFFCGDVTDKCRQISDVKFDILIADPPWWNKYIRRLKASNNKLSYSMMYNEDIASIPVQHLFSDNCIVAVWCTNAPTNIRAVIDMIFPEWGVKYAATWYWLKINTNMEPVCEFSSGCKKQPFERIILGTVGKLKFIPDNEIVVSLPSALHSHKPPLIELLKPYVEMSKPQTLELFARYLLPNTTSVGYEPLKWQHLSLYESVP